MKKMEKKNPTDWSYYFIKYLLQPIFIFYYRPKTYNKEYILKEGPIIIAGNHKHLMDQCLVLISTRRVVNYMAKKEYFDGKFAWFFKLAGCIPVNRSIKDQNAKDKALHVLKNNGAIGIFPEGTRNKTQAFLLPFKYGAVSLAKKTNATIIPFGITGDYKFWSKNLTITFGQPFKVDDLSIEEANQKLTNEVGNLMKKTLK
ncbi:MAG: 1-acyl-sn-glycerol-3-phosphate acyltransferase [Firmicutes bacterium]|nr:1-acyl-sn-glycerol-3-phosphate acyltransferase [Bacillota bacterium]